MCVCLCVCAYLQNYEKYWSKEIVSSGLKRGELVQVKRVCGGVCVGACVHDDGSWVHSLQGVLHINTRDFTESYVSDPVSVQCRCHGLGQAHCIAYVKENGPDWFMPGILERNRAMEGDLVVIQPYPPELWTVSVVWSAQLRKYNSLTLDTDIPQPMRTESETEFHESMDVSETDECVGVPTMPYSSSTEGMEVTSLFDQGPVRVGITALNPVCFSYRQQSR